MPVKMGIVGRQAWKSIVWHEVGVATGVSRSAEPPPQHRRTTAGDPIGGHLSPISGGEDESGCR